MKLLRTFPKDAFEFGLASWRWLGLREQTPRFATCFGDIFLESLDGWWFLDTVEGTLELRWTTAVHMYAELESPEGRATYLMDDLVREARGRGIHLGEEDVYTFNPHPALGGQLGVDSIVPMRFELAVSWLGAVHDQVLHHSGQNLPPLPDEGRRDAPQVAAAWDSAWSHDETFDVPFEQYLATTTFAAVARPRHGAPARTATPAEQPWAARGAEPAAAWDAPTGTPGPASAGRPADAEAGWSDAQWPGTRPGLEPGVDTGHDTGLDSAGSTWSGASAADADWSGAGADWTSAADPARDTFAPDGSALDGQGTAGYPAPPADGTPHGTAWAEPTWSAPAWPGTGWGGQEPAVAAGGTQQAPPADPFTAWDDLWGRR